MQKNFQSHIAFTLAEVLITLGIIGVVAALTMPILVQNHRKQVTVNKLKKFYTNINNAIGMVEAEYGEPKNWVLNCNTTTCDYDTALKWWNDYIGKYLKTTEIKKHNDNNFLVYFEDGTILRVETRIRDFHFYTDQKALNNPKGGVNAFMFRYNPIAYDGNISNPNLKYAIKPTMEPYAVYWDGTRENLLSGNSTFSCDRCITSPAAEGFCAKLIQYDGWKISKDYPCKF